MIEDFFSYLINLPQEGLLKILKFFFIFLSLFLLGGIIYFLLVTDFLEKRFLLDLRALMEGKAREKGGKIAKKLKKAKKLLEKDKEADWKLALIQTVQILRKILKIHGFSGKTFLEQIEKAGPEIFPPEKLDQILRAWQITFSVIQDPDYRLSREKAKAVFEIFEKTIQELTII